MRTMALRKGRLRVGKCVPLTCRCRTNCGLKSLTTKLAGGRMVEIAIYWCGHSQRRNHGKPIGAREWRELERRLDPS